MSDQDVIALIKRIERGDREAFAAFVRRHQRAVVRVCRAVVDDDAAAEDAAQEAFIAVWRALTSGAGPHDDGTYRGWLFTIARNAGHRRRRRRAGEPAAMVDIDDVAHADNVADGADVWAARGVAAGWGDNPEGRAVAAERRRCVQAALARLAVGEREIITLRDVNGLSGEETAAVLGISIAAEKSRVHRARLALMAHLGDCRDDDDEHPNDQQHHSPGGAR
jgi:RNA polymerase sigma-70 factor (ECF subfamily)